MTDAVELSLRDKAINALGEAFRLAGASSGAEPSKSVAARAFDEACQAIDALANESREQLAGTLIDAWVAAHKRPTPWATAIEITAIVTHMPENERARLLAL